jgi:4-hydroxy-2-oxoheptanedioate aldolase
MELKTIINKLVSNKNVVGIKQSFEDEGVLLDDVSLMRRITELNELKLSVKIGGCEAISDIYNCKNIGVNGIVAPMIETEFALQKFIESVIHIKDIDFYINIESKTGYENLDKILSSPSAKLLTGVVVGRSDLVKSYGYDKNFVDSDFVFDIVQNIMKKAKSYNLTTLMGGGLSPNSTQFIKKLYSKKLIDFIETRNVIIKLNGYDTIDDDIKSAIEFETHWLEYKAKKYNDIGNSYQKRANTIKNRL